MARTSPNDLTVNSLSGSELFRAAHEHFSKLSDSRDPSRIEIPIEDFFMSALAIFSLKIPSLLQFEEEMRKQRSFSNIKKLFYVSKVPSDTRMREVIDEYQNNVFRPVIRAIFERAQRAKVLKGFELWDNTYGLAVDGTGYFSSDSVHCENCLEKKQRGGNERTFHHQMLAGALVHPDQRCVIPVCPEAIQQQDGNTKNDCEQNAMKRFLLGYREDHPKLKTVLLTDALHATLPCLELLTKLDIDFVLSVKPGSHEKLFGGVDTRETNGTVHHFEEEESDSSLPVHQLFTLQVQLPADCTRWAHAVED